jgi:hypothetical protein
MTDHKGIAVLIVILLVAFLSARGMGVTLAFFMDRLAAGNMSSSMAMLYAADAGIELAARELAQVGEFDAALSGAAIGAFADGAPAGVRSIPGGGTIDLTAATNALNCGQINDCTDAQMNANSNQRPWGTNNPRWKLFVYGPMTNVAPLVRPAMCYLAVWIGDDGREQDGDPSVDSNENAAGHGIVRVHAEAYGFGGLRRAVEAELVRVCPLGPDQPCLPGIRVQSWQELRQALP